MVFELKAPHEYHSPLQRCVIRVGEFWYDCTTWRHSHPGGAEFIDQFNNRDATDAFYALHSKEAVAKLLKMKAKPVSPSDGPRDQVSLNFEKFRLQLEKDGFFDRSWVKEATIHYLPTFLMLIIGTMISYSYPLLATLLISMGMQQNGWTGHDITHGRGKACYVASLVFGAIINGFSREWWTHKHSMHHTFPNRKDYDSDIHNEPILHLWFPDDAADDKPWRRYQHLYYPIVYSLLWASWRMQSIQFALASGNWPERILLALGYMWLACLPWKVAIGSVLLGGFCVAIVVTANHQTEEILAADDKYNYVVDQFRTTRGVATKDPFMEYFFGGMQYQLEHHLFPTMPRYYYPAVRPLIHQFAKENGMQYHVSGVLEILKMNFDVMKKNAAERPAVNKRK
jgi:fatty acid desaturase